MSTLLATPSLGRAYADRMSHSLRQGILIALGGVGLTAAVISLARRQLISLRYALGWTFIAISGAAGALLVPTVQPIAELFGMSPTGLLLAAATVVLLAITLQLSISVSGLQEQVRSLAEAHSLLEHRTRQVEEAGAVDG